MKKTRTPILFFLLAMLLSCTQFLSAQTYYEGPYPKRLTGLSEMVVLSPYAGAEAWIEPSTSSKITSSGAGKDYCGIVGEFANLSSNRFIQFYLTGCSDIEFAAQGNGTRRFVVEVNDIVVFSEALAKNCNTFTVSTATTAPCKVTIKSPDGSVYPTSITFQAPAGPTVSLTQGQADAIAIATLAIDPIVYTYSNVDDVTLTWTVDTPAGISADKNAEAKTLTISGTPTTADVYGYTVSVAEGNTLTGSLTVSPYTTPTPEITVPTNSSQSKKAGVAIEDIIYNFKYATGATVEGLPGGLTAVYADSKMTISGTLPTASSYPATYTYTVSATPLDGYIAEMVSVTGVITVKDPNAKSVLYLTLRETSDLLLDQMDRKYDVTRRAPLANFAGNYDDYELIVLHESLTGNDVQAAGHELALIKSVNKSILNTKSYFYTSTRWNWGAAANGNSQSSITMSPIAPRHPIFEGIADTEGVITLLSVDMAKNIQPIASFTSDNYKGYELATVPDGVAIHEIPAEGRGVGITAKYLMVSLLNDAFANLTPDGLKLLDNACEYLLSSAVYIPITVSVDQIVSSELYFDGHMLHNPSSVSIELFDMAGRSLVRTSSSASLEQLNRGVYLVRELESGRQMKVVK